MQLHQFYVIYKEYGEYFTSWQVHLNPSYRDVNTPSSSVFPRNEIGTKCIHRGEEWSRISSHSLWRESDLPLLQLWNSFSQHTLYRCILHHWSTVCLFMRKKTEGPDDRTAIYIDDTSSPPVVMNPYLVQVTWSVRRRDGKRGRVYGPCFLNVFLTNFQRRTTKRNDYVLRENNPQCHDPWRTSNFRTKCLSTLVSWIFPSCWHQPLMSPCVEYSPTFFLPLGGFLHHACGVG